MSKAWNLPNRQKKNLHVHYLIQTDQYIAIYRSLSNAADHAVVINKDHTTDKETTQLATVRVNYVGSQSRRSHSHSPERAFVIKMCAGRRPVPQRMSSTCAKLISERIRLKTLPPLN